MEQQILEAIKLRKIIEEKPKGYLKEKKYVAKEDITTLKKIHDFVMKSKSTTAKKGKSSKPKMKSLFDY